MESRRNGPQLSSRHDDDDEIYLRQPAYEIKLMLWRIS